MNNELVRKETMMYVWAKDMLQIYVYLTMLIGPGFGCDAKTIGEGKHINVYFDSLKLNGMSISKLDEEETLKFKESNSCEEESKGKNLFFIYAIEKGVINFKERMEELSVFCNNGYFLNGDIITKINKNLEIPKNLQEYQRNMLLRCAKAMKYDVGLEKANDTNVSSEEIQYHYGLVLNLGFTKDRPFFEVKNIQEENLYLLKDLFDFVETRFFERNKNFFIRAGIVGERLDTLAFVYWVYFNLGVTKVEEITNESNFENLLSSYKDYLESENLNATKLTKNIKPLVFNTK